MQHLNILLDQYKLRKAIFMQHLNILLDQYKLRKAIFMQHLRYCCTKVAILWPINYSWQIFRNSILCTLEDGWSFRFSNILPPEKRISKSDTFRPNLFVFVQILAYLGQLSTKHSNPLLLSTVYVFSISFHRTPPLPPPPPLHTHTLYN